MAASREVIPGIEGEASLRDSATGGAPTAPTRGDARPGGEEPREPASAGQADHLFVYGTLMRGECRHPLLNEDRCRLVEPAASVAGTLWRLGNGAYPGLRLGAATPGALVEGGPAGQAVADRVTPPPGGGRVLGEVYQLNAAAELFAVLDKVEGFHGNERPSLFRRALLEVRRCDGTPLLAWTYLYAGEEEGVLIPSGNWRRR